MRFSRIWCAKTPERSAAWRVALLAIAALAGAPARAEWTAFEPEEGRFTVALPGAPSVERDAHFTPVGSIAMTKYWLRVGGALLAVEMHDIPPVAAAVIPDETILDRARESLLREVHGTLIDGRSLAFLGEPAREFRYRLPGSVPLVERVLAVLVGSRLYLVTGMARDPATDPDVARFFASFRCWREPSGG
jgi:hypothetical protein